MLKIKRLKIDNYGTLSNREIELGGGLNVIYGKNESGKSTMRSFLHAMFYGLKNSSEKSDRKKYMPWSGGGMSGAMLVERDGKEIELRRTFGARASGDKFSASDPVSGEAIEGIFSDNAGEELLGVSENVFIKTAYIKQGTAAAPGADGEITARLMNLAASGDEDISAEKTLDVIERAKRSLKAKNKTYSPGAVDRLAARKNTLLEERFRAERMEREAAEKRKHLARLCERRDGVLSELKRAEGLRARKADAAAVKDGKLLKRLGKELAELRENSLLKSFDGFDEEDCRETESRAARLAELSAATAASEIDERERRLGDLEAEDGKSKAGLCIVGVCCAVTLLVIGVIFGTVLSGALYALCALGVILGAACAALLVKSNKRAKAAEAARDEIKAELDELRARECERERERGELKAELDAEYERLGISGIEQLRVKYREYIRLTAAIEASEKSFADVLGDRNAEELIEKSARLEAELAGLEDEINGAGELTDRLIISRDELDAQIRKCEFELDNLPIVSISDIDGEIGAIDEELGVLETRLAALEIADSEIRAAFDEARGSFGAVLNREVNSRLKTLTGGKYGDVRVSNEYGMKILAGGEPIDAASLSMGTYEQIYLALRLGIAELICGNNIVVIADDICAQYDDERAEYALGQLREASEKYQVIMFTCHDRDLRNAEKTEGVNVVRL